jgi:hypothetical protein
MSIGDDTQCQCEVKRIIAEFCWCASLCACVPVCLCLCLSLSVPGSGSGCRCGWAERGHAAGWTRDGHDPRRSVQ